MLVGTNHKVLATVLTSVRSKCIVYRPRAERKLHILYSTVCVWFLSSTSYVDTSLERREINRGVFYTISNILYDLNVLCEGAERPKSYDMKREFNIHTVRGAAQSIATREDIRPRAALRMMRPRP